MFTTTRKLLQIKGLSEAKVNKIKEAAKAMESADFLTGTELREKRAEIMKAMRPRPTPPPARDAEPRPRRRSRPGPAISTLSSAAASRPPASPRSSASSARARRSSATLFVSRRSSRSTKEGARARPCILIPKARSDRSDS